MLMNGAVLKKKSGHKASPDQYSKALGHMGMTNENTITPLWWAIQK